MNAVLKAKQVARLEADIARHDARIAADKADGHEPTPEDLQYRSAIQDELDAVQAAPVDTPQRTGAEADEFQQLEAGLQLRSYIGAMLGGVSLSGREAEYNAERKLGRDHIPLAAMRPRNLQYRQDARTTITAGDFDSNLAPTVLPVFVNSDMAFLGADIQSVPVGERRVPVISGTTKAAAKAKGASTNAADAGVSAVALLPRRNTIRVTAAIEDLDYEFEGLEDSLRAYMAGRMVEQLDADVISRASTGIVNELTAPTTGTTVVAVDDLTADILGMIDGVNAQDIGQVRVLLGAVKDSNGRSAMNVIGKLRLTTGQREVAALRAEGAGIRGSGHLPAPSSDDTTAILVAGAAGNELKIAVWDAARFVVVEKDQTGERALNLHGFWDSKIVVESGWNLESYHLA